MSLEAKIEALTVAVAALTQVMCQGAATPVASPAVAPAPPPVLTQPVAAVVPVPVAANAPVMPPLPTFIPPTPPPVVSTDDDVKVPFNDSKGMIAYVMESYKALGPQKGALIQNVLKDCGVQNINDVAADKFKALYKGVEALKAS